MLVMRTHMWYNIINHMAVGESVFAGSEPSGGETYAEIVAMTVPFAACAGDGNEDETAGGGSYTVTCEDGDYYDLSASSS